MSNCTIINWSLIIKKKIVKFKNNIEQVKLTGMIWFLSIEQNCKNIIAQFEPSFDFSLCLPSFNLLI